MHLEGAYKDFYSYPKPFMYICVSKWRIIILDCILVTNKMDAEEQSRLYAFAASREDKRLQYKKE